VARGPSRKKNSASRIGSCSDNQALKQKQKLKPIQKQHQPNWLLVGSTIKRSPTDTDMSPAETTPTPKTELYIRSVNLKPAMHVSIVRCCVMSTRAAFEHMGACVGVLWQVLI
jgi:hypothetical protein